MHRHQIVLYTTRAAAQVVQPCLGDQALRSGYRLRSCGLDLDSTYMAEALPGLAQTLGNCCLLADVITLAIEPE